MRVGILALESSGGRQKPLELRQQLLPSGGEPHSALAAYQQQGYAELILKEFIMCVSPDWV